MTAAFGASKSSPPLYTAGTAFLPIPAKNPVVGVDTGDQRIRESVDFYSTVLQSTAILEKVGSKKYPSRTFQTDELLATIYDVKGLTRERIDRKVHGRLKNMMEVKVKDKPKMIRLRITTIDPVLAAALANSFVEELITYIASIKLGRIRESIVFARNRVEEVEQKLQAAENALSTFRKRNRKISSPELKLEEDRLQRAVKVEEGLFLTLKKKLEILKIEEKQEMPTIKVIERATPPLSRNGPGTKTNVILAGFIAFVLVSLLAFLLESVSGIDTTQKSYREFQGHMRELLPSFLWPK
jgi:uncharacterized protein involved in exopolysaccharide biosynthesis